MDELYKAKVSPLILKALAISLLVSKQEVRVKGKFVAW